MKELDAFQKEQVDKVNSDWNPAEATVFTALNLVCVAGAIAGSVRCLRVAESHTDRMLALASVHDSLRAVLKDAAVLSRLVGKNLSTLLEEDQT